MKNGRQFNGQMKRRQKDKQGSTKHYTQSKRLNNTPLRIFDELRFPGRVSLPASHPSCYSLAIRESCYVEIVVDTGMHTNK